MKSIRIIFFFFSVFVGDFFSPSFAGIHNKTSGGSSFFWNSKTISFVVHERTLPSNISLDSFMTIFQESINSLAGELDLTIQVTVNYSNNAMATNQNDIYFSNNPLYFTSDGGGSLAVTEASYSDSNGEILEADILLHNGVNFSLEKTSIIYLGNILTHELGHALGLAHSLTQNSSMIYSVTRGQYIAHSDDILGLQEVYSSKDQTTTKGTITGKVVGGSSTELIGVFGAYIQLISAKTGKIIQGTLSDYEGSFSFTSLPLSDSYLVYVSPVFAYTGGGIPSYYSSRRQDICPSRSNYTNSFFDKCGGENAGRPVAISLETATPSVDIGNVAVRCEYSVAQTRIEQLSIPFVLSDKFTSTSDLSNWEYYPALYAQAEKHTYTLDLSGQTIQGIENGNIHAAIRVIGQEIYSPLKMDLKITRLFDNVSTQVPYLIEGEVVNYVISSKHRPDIDASIRLLLSSNPENNKFLIELIPYNFWSFLTEIRSGNSAYNWSPDDIMPAQFALSPIAGDDPIYALSLSLEQESEGNFTPIDWKKSSSLSDNSQCLQATMASSISRPQQSSASTVSVTEEKKQGIFGCGSLLLLNKDDDNNPPPNGFLILSYFLLGIFLSFFIKKASFYFS